MLNTATVSTADLIALTCHIHKKHGALIGSLPPSAHLLLGAQEMINGKQGQSRQTVSEIKIIKCLNI